MQNVEKKKSILMSNGFKRGVVGQVYITSKFGAEMIADIC